MEFVDTLTYLKRLEEAGFTRQQAEAQMDIFLENVRTSVATRKDLVETTSHIRVELIELRSAINVMDIRHRSDMAQLRADMKSLEDRITIRLGGLMIVGIGALAALIKLT